MQTQPLEAPSKGTWKQTVNTALTSSEARLERLERRRLELELGAGAITIRPTALPALAPSRKRSPGYG